MIISTDDISRLRDCQNYIFLTARNMKRLQTILTPRTHTAILQYYNNGGWGGGGGGGVALGVTI